MNKTFYDIRKKLKVDQDAMAKLLGLDSQGAVSHYESGRRFPRQKTLLQYLALAKKHGIEVSP